MGHEKKQRQDEAGPSAPIWMVTFSDCMNLLLTFFVLLVTFSSFDTQVLTNLGAVFRRILPGISFIPDQAEMDKSAFLPTTQLMPVEAHAKGSEKPTLAGGPQDNLEQQTEPADFYTRKVFLIDSEDIFWGRGSVISFQGREVLATMASFLKQVHSRVVISENGPEDQSNDQFGLHRAWAVREYLVEKHQLNKNQFSISAASTLRDSSGYGSALRRDESPVTRDSSDPSSVAMRRVDERPATSDGERTLEIVLLERGIYN